MKKLTFEFVDVFDIAELENCATDEGVERLFFCRHGDSGIRWKLTVRPKIKQGEKETFGLYLHIVDPPGVLSVDYDLFAGNKDISRSERKVKFGPKSSGWGYGAFLPNVASLQERGLVVDGVVKFGVKIVLKASVFHSSKWLPAASLKPDKNPILRHLFTNLGTDDHHGTDFILIVGERDDKKELHVNRLALRAVSHLDCVFNIESKEYHEGALHLPRHTADAVIEVFRYLYLNQVGVDLTRFLPSLFNLAWEWELKPLLTEIERAMVVKLQTDRSNTDLASDYLDLAIHCNEFLDSVAACILIDNWTKFLASPNNNEMMEYVKYRVSDVMAEAALYKGVSTWMDADPLSALPAASLTPDTGRIARQLFANLGTDDHFGTDFIITVEEGEAKKDLHVCRQALRFVPFFYQMFNKENQERVLSLPTHTVDAVTEVLRFIYLNEVGADLTRFLPSLLELASEWQLDELMTAIESDMIKKLQADRFHTDYKLAATYLELADRYERKVVGRVATRKLIASWPQFIRSEKARYMREELKNKVTRVMAAIASGTAIDDGE